MIPADTHPDAHAVQIALIRGMDADTKFRQIVQMCEDARALGISGIRARHPEYSEDQVKQASHRLFLGDELFREVWPEKELLPL